MYDEDEEIDQDYVPYRGPSDRIKKLTRKEVLEEYEESIKTAARRYKKGVKRL